MSTQLTPQVGDRVRLVHEEGSMIIGEIVDIPMTADWNGWTVKEVGSFYEDRGWKVTEILAKPVPPAGTFLTGVVKGARFNGVVTDTGRVNYFLDDAEHYLADASDLDSWEVVQ